MSLVRSVTPVRNVRIEAYISCEKQCTTNQQLSRRSNMIKPMKYYLELLKAAKGQEQEDLLVSRVHTDNYKLAVVAVYAMLEGKEGDYVLVNREKQVVSGGKWGDKLMNRIAKELQPPEEDKSNTRASASK